MECKMNILQIKFIVFSSLDADLFVYGIIMGVLDLVLVQTHTHAFSLSFTFSFPFPHRGIYLFLSSAQ